MQAKQVDHARDSCLRFVFDHTVVSFRLSAGVTFAEIARTLDGLSFQRHGSPITIDIIPASPEDGSVQRMARQPGFAIHWPNVVAPHAVMGG